MTDKPLSQGAPIRVLFLNTRSALGADVAVHLTLMKSFSPAECEVSLVTNSRSADLAKLLAEIEGLPGLRVDVMDLGFELTGRGKLGKLTGAAANVATMAGALFRLSRLVRSRRIEIIHCTDRPRDALFTTLLARLTGRKSILHLHIKWDTHMGRATRWAVRNCSGLLAISQFVAKSMEADGIQVDKIHTSLNASDPVTFDPVNHRLGDWRESIGVDSSTPLIGLVGRVMFWKGHLDLVEAFAIVKKSIPNAVLAFVGRDDPGAGGGPSFGDQVRAKAETLGVQDSVRWTGWFDGMPTVFGDLDVVCVPSWEEPFGLVVTEAMAMCRPVVGYASGALPEIIDSGIEGILVPPKDTETMAAAIVSLLENPDMRRAMGEAGRARVLRQFTPRRQAAEVAAIYRRICRP